MRQSGWGRRKEGGARAGWRQRKEIGDRGRAGDRWRKMKEGGATPG